MTPTMDALHHQGTVEYGEKGDLAGSDSENGFVCDVPNCHKSFSRADRLARHQLNHENFPRHRCPWPDCGKTFVRNDVFKKHYRRQHEGRLEVQESKVTKPASLKFIVMDKTNITRAGKAVDPRSDISVANEATGINSSEKKVNKEDPGVDDVHNKEVSKPSNSHKDYLNDTNQEDLDYLHLQESIPSVNLKENGPTIHNQLPQHPPVISSDQNENAFQQNDTFGLSAEELVSSDELIRWLFGGIESKTSETGSAVLSISPNESLDNYPELEEFEYPFQRPLSVADISESPSMELETTGFPFSNEQVLIDHKIMEALEEVLPAIKFQENFRQQQLQYYLENYWRYYHPQFPILNKPSFSTRKSHPILLLSMLTMGAYIASALTDGQTSIMFSDSIATPLRWDIYRSKEFKPPPKLWVVQSLVLLESYEICCSSRDLHERANLHRGLSIQMLKRSPMFGGNPWFKYTTSSLDKITNDPMATRKQWTEWIEEESMKRCALATFYLETLHAVVFGHDMIIDLHDVKPTLPCNEDFWRSGKYTKKCLQAPPTLLAAIKSILHKKPVRVRGFGRKIILSGLIALSFEVKDREFELSIPELKSIKELWQRKIREAFTFWDMHCSVSPKDIHSSWTETFSLPLRELYESYTHMKHYDFMVYAGAPGRMNVRFSEKEMEIVNSRVGDWADSLHGTRAVVFVFSYLHRLMAAKKNTCPYNPRQDRCLYRKQIISHLLVILWCYTFHCCGPESRAYEWNYSNPDLVPSKEDGHEYLSRVVGEFELLAGKKFCSQHIYDDIDLFAQVLPSISAKQNVVGLLRLFKTDYSSDLSEIAREHSRLLNNCINRSLGSRTVFCRNMFE